MMDQDATRSNEHAERGRQISAAQVDPAIHDAVVFNENGDRFMTGAVEAMSAAQRFQRETEARSNIEKQVKELMLKIHQFCQEHSEIECAIIGFEFTGWACEFATSGDYRSDEIADAMSEFAVKIHADYPDLSIAFHTYPASRASEEELSASQDNRLRIYPIPDAKV